MRKVFLLFVDPVMILYSSWKNLPTTVQVAKNNNDYILEGIAAVFGQENNNHRIYEEKEYLPHLDYLQKKIERKKAVGRIRPPV